MRDYFHRICMAIPLMVLSFAGNTRPPWKERAADPAFIHSSLKKVTDIIVYDVFSPPVASRIYAYVSLAGYETARFADSSCISLVAQFRQQGSIPSPDNNAVYSFSLAAAEAMLLVGKALVISEDSIARYRLQLHKEMKATGMPADVFDRSVAYGASVAKQILAWAATDNYKQTRSFARYTMSDEPGAWKPTPPAYMKAVEPHWNRIRPFLLDSAAQFKPVPALPFSIDTISSFYREAKEVLTTGQQLTEEQKAIASFWDCNPFRMNVSGHVMFATKKISPGGHWINIAAQACQIQKAGFVRSLEVYAMLAVTLADAFISCWDEKYRSQVIRPETYINQYIDPGWIPFLQTPPFPEYPSGHSVASAAAAVVMTHLFGDQFAYTDATEVEFGLPARTYTSFWHAANEAAISRLYGGIHYKAAITHGLEEGTKVGQLVVTRLKTRK